MFRHATFIALATALAGCAATGPQTVARLGSNPVVTGGSYSSGGGLTVAADLRETQGRTLICGVWAQSDQQSILTKGKARGVVASGSVALGGQTITRGLEFMTEVPPMADYAGQDAGCTLIDRPWQDGDAARDIEIRIPRQVVHVEADEFGAFSVTFKQSGPGAGGI